MILPIWENIVERKMCPLSGEEFFVTDKDLEFYDKISPIFNGKKYSIPSPKLCPRERERRRLAWKNNRGLTAAAEGGGLSMFNNQYHHVSYQPHVYWTDAWNPFDYATNFDFNMPAFDQLHALNQKVPKLARSITNEENSDFVNNAGFVKDCYWIFESSECEKCYFGEDCFRLRNCLDFLGANRCEFCYEIVDCSSCNMSYFCVNCTDCVDAWFCHSCLDCKNCFGCMNLKKKQFCFFNEQLTQEEYTKRFSQMSVEKHRDLIRQKLAALRSSEYFRESQNLNSEGAIGDQIFNCQNVANSFIVFDSRDVRYSQIVQWPCHNIYDLTSFGINCSFFLECCTCGQASNNLGFCVECTTNLSNLWYCQFCNKSITNCFLSTGLKMRADHCIMNKAYGAQEYDELAWKIVDHMQSTGEWGEFFPHKYSPFGYNDSVAQEYYPLTEAEVHERGWVWTREESKSFTGAVVNPLPIEQYDERVVGYQVAKANIDALRAGAIRCEVTGKYFRIIAQELVFYIENHLPIPRRHPDARHRDRMKYRNPRQLYDRNCVTCNKLIHTTFAPERTEKVVCEECYRKLVY